MTFFTFFACNFNKLGIKYSCDNKTFTGGVLMSNIVIDFNRPFDPKLLDCCIQNRLPKFISDVILILDISDNPLTDFNSIVVTKYGQWYITHQTTSQLFNLLQANYPISYILIKKIIKHFAKIHKKIPYCFGDFLYFPIYTSTPHHHWCAYHHCIEYKCYYKNAHFREFKNVQN